MLPVGRGCSIASDEFMPLQFMPLHKKPAFLKISKEDFIARLHGHNCWRGRIVITPTGDVLPCPLVRDIVLGNVQHQSLPDIIASDSLKQIWRLTKDKIETCQDCEYRYACFDCRAKAESLTSKPADCWYNPYESLDGLVNALEVQ
ncbi:MAG: Coenzyme PQQ synthesis protein E [Dehalococcoidia bacterium]|nr:Coenzyme PQQ synthesis protein E [Bacillota bacterium]